MEATPKTNPTFRVKLPFPPSVNHYYKIGKSFNGKPNKRISEQGKVFRLEVKLAVKKIGSPRFMGKLRLQVYAYMPNHRQRDLDNLLKATQDALEKAEVYSNDSQIVSLLVENYGVSPEDPCLVVVIEEIPFKKRVLKGVVNV